ncbi:DNA topoisomerase 1 [Desulfoluna limicola]|uniref:DNA topoisomerase 1 n=1 Tax=Desulfoluna limicola TaxID=2810562 RepID=A0ABM7PGF1_9BACT|nr:type I DNA topoisomerase [Desulfoluna limicola]BCS96141.1 DNA topoisomerase 1 [Desulfoluna limicola]
MSKPLVIVESPTKVRTLKKYIGKTYNVAATSGHIKDLPPKEIGIDIDKGFKAKYLQIKGKSKIIKDLKAAAANTTEIYLAPDPDREGEAIAFHTADILKGKDRTFKRVLFHELTQRGIEEALSNPTELNYNRYDAQQARRILDRLVGYQVSPLLWKKVQGGLSAGRVQSVAVRIICEREHAIQRFEPEEYWSIAAELKGDTDTSFIAKLAKVDGNKVDIKNGETATAMVEELSNTPYKVEKITRRTKKRNPLPPFTTSKLQQEAINRLRFSARKTMSVAQQLYEGVDLGPGEPVGLITYMRTDSIRIANEAAVEAGQFIHKKFGSDYAIDAPRFFKNKNKAQDAHEAIRPTSVFNTPEKVASFLDEDQRLLYTLIWKRFVASQMQQALIDQVSVAIASGRFTFSLSGSTVRFPGFMTLYAYDDAKKDDDKKQQLPELNEGEALSLIKLDPKQHFTSPPPRFSEASLVKELEENGIGRPSTYATILSTIRNKGYVDLVNRYFRPSELGFIVNDLLVANFPDVFDVEFTAGFENSLDKVEAAEIDYVDLLKEFYASFDKELEEATANMISVKGVGIETELTCPQCKKEKLHVKIGRNGSFIACNGYPECDYSRNYERDEKGVIHPIEPSFELAEGKVCDKCGKPMLLKQGRYGEFLACSGYPDCKNTMSVNGDAAGGTGADTGVSCPEKGCEGTIVEKRSKRGKIFYGCNKYPDCSFAIWEKPVLRACELCGAPFVVEKTTKRDGTFLKCLSDGCDFKEPVEKSEEG